ncbi:hypothetical protein [Halomicrobium sp. LC1Hm]|uniref:hypothetical protein n=1 Tax=Halomicrobium sp. LC1Hm TaxID=2610902 RepID=UPI00129828BA|nr:hypothetical protein [Halomicrobium sp. LC1Hm]QGA82110.1 hypothetical protein LC1Hm_1050 [Halomicrobium sp. LC1Hm]
MFGLRDSDDTQEEEEEERLNLPIQVTTMLIERDVKEANENIDILNHEYDWQVYRLPVPGEDQIPTLGQLREIDEDLRRLYNKVSEQRPLDTTERRRIIRARQSVQELIDFYLYFDQITKPVEESSAGSDDEGGVPSASV